MFDPKKLQDLISGGYEDGLDNIADTEEVLYESIIKMVLGYLLKGNLDSNLTDFQLIKEINEELIKAIEKSGYVKKIDDFIPLLDDIAEETINLVREANGSVRFTKKVVNLTQEKKNAINTIVNRLNGAESIEANISDPIRQILYQAINNNATLADAEAMLRPLIIGDAQKGGLLSRYYKTIAKDSLNQWSGRVQQKISTEYGLIDFMYVGQNKTTSRAQCIRWISEENGVLIKEVIEAELKEARSSVRSKSKRFQGYSAANIPTVANFATVRGGHGCDDLAIAFLATEEEAEAAINSYNTRNKTRLRLKYQELRKD